MRPHRLSLLAALLIFGCRSESTTSEASAPESGPHGLPARNADEVAAAKLDLEGIEIRGTLRFLVRGDGERRFLPRSGEPATESLDQVEAFAKWLRLKPELVLVNSHEELIPALLEGRGDIIAAGLAVTKARTASVSFARSVRGVKEMVVGKEGATKPPRAVSELSGREVHVRASSAYAETLAEQKVEGLEVVPVPEYLDTPDIIEDVAEGRRPLTVADDVVLATVRSYEPRAVGLFALREGRELAWAVRPSSVKLRAAIERFQTERALAEPLDPIFTGDLEGIKKRGVLRVLTRNNPVTYFLHRGRPYGFEYELMKKLADELDVRLAMIVAPDRSQLVPWLLEGRGDLIAASMTVLESRARKVAFSQPYLFTREVVVKPEGDPLSTVADLDGRSIHVRRSSSYWTTLEALEAQGVKVRLEPAPEDVETETLIEEVAGGRRPLTVADDYILGVEQTYGTKVEPGPVLTSSAAKPVAFAVRPSNPQLLARVSTFVRANYRKLEYNIYRKRYFENSRRIRKAKSFRVDQTGKISPYDALIRKYAERYELDWRLMAAQAYVESGFDPKAKSWVGALGLFQVMPNTGRSLGLANLQDPETGIHAGIKYMSRLISRFDAELPFAERVWFALAAYNAGLGHVIDARRLARAQGMNGDAWFGNVEKAMLLLSRPEFARKARHGYARGGEPVAYVARIRDVYQAYRGATDGQSGR